MEYGQVGNIDLPDEQGFVTFNDPLPGWEAFVVSVRADLVKGEPRITGVRVEPREGVKVRDAVLTIVRLRSLPLARLAPVAYHLRTLRPDRIGDLFKGLDGMTEHVRNEALELAEKAERGKTDAEAVAKIYKAVMEAGPTTGDDGRTRRPAPRSEICKTFHVSTRTADRYIAEARRLGLLAAYTENDNKSITKGGTA